MNDNDLIRFADECPWAVARLKRRHGVALAFYLLGKLNSEILATSAIHLTWWLLPQLCAEIGADDPIEFLMRVADCAIVTFRNLPNTLGVAA